MNQNLHEQRGAEVSIVRCPDYDKERISTAVRRAVELIGGMTAFVKPGQRVFIKPNLLKSSPPSAAVVTHPEIIRAVIKLVREAGATAMVGDSPGLGDLRHVCEKSGVLSIIEEEGALLADTDHAVKVKNNGQFHHFEIAQSVWEADAVINLPKLKTHGMMTITGAVKNLFGCIPGKRKAQWHLNAGVNRAAFARMLVELCSLIKPRLTIIDAVIGMEGNGPGSGDPRVIGLVLAGQDPVAVDVVCGKIVGVQPSSLYTVKAAREAGIGETRLDKIRIRGEEIHTVALDRFRLPPQEHTDWPLPEWAKRFLKNALTTRPVVDHRECIRCGVCEKHCPQGAIRSNGRQLVVRYHDCIRCFCCQEFCPQGAITVGKGWALKMIG